MDNNLRHYTVDSTLNAFRNPSKFGDGATSYSTDTVLRLDSPRVLTSCVSNLEETKRKWSVSQGLQNDSSLVLGLGCSVSSSDTKGGSSATGYTAISSLKEVEYDSKDLDLDFHLHLGNQRTHSAKKFSNVTRKTEGVEKPKLDLNLSLSTGPAESGITSVTLDSAPYENNAERLVASSAVQLVDEGSTSGRWRSRHLVPPLHTLHATVVAPALDHVLKDKNPPSPVIIPELSSAMLAVPNEPLYPCGITHQQRKRNTSGRICQVMECGRGARGASGRCISHGGGRRCQKDGCQRGAEGRTVFCKGHGGGKRCQYLGCTRSAEGRTDLCISHGGGRRCNHEGCVKAARGKSGLCIRHGGGKRCRVESCARSAEGLSGLCISHGGGRRCQQLGCNKGAQGSTMFCKGHGGGKRCKAVGCNKGAEGSTAFCKGHGGGKRCSFEEGCPRSVHGGTLFCVRHGGGKRCASEGCTRSARGKTSHCVRHGGGKRCKHEGCGKSAQGSTDYCKSHGGGKRCSWVSCEKFARGKSGLCTSHSVQVQAKRVECTHTDGLNAQSAWNLTGTEFTGFGNQMEKTEALEFSLPEGRVHGGSLMAMLRGQSSIDIGQSSKAAAVKSSHMPFCSV